MDIDFDGIVKVIVALTSLIGAVGAALATWKASQAKATASEAADIGTQNSQQIADVHSEVQKQGRSIRGSITPIADSLVAGAPEANDVPPRAPARRTTKKGQ